VKCLENNHEDNELRISCEEESMFLSLLKTGVLASEFSNR
jgi:hypothetical protein